MVSLVGPRAMIGYELRQARKGATVVADSCAAVWLARATTLQWAYAACAEKDLLKIACLTDPSR
tara:strand:+ start:2355 stop:2546 length:192 start_codon:yes stop_codon:yes gene_type:complete